MEINDFQNRLKAYKKVKGRNPSLSYWQWKQNASYSEGTGEEGITDDSPGFFGTVGNFFRNAWDRAKTTGAILHNISDAVIRDPLQNVIGRTQDNSDVGRTYNAVGARLSRMQADIDRTNLPRKAGQVKPFGVKAKAIKRFNGGHYARFGGDKLLDALTGGLSAWEYNNGQTSGQIMIDPEDNSRYIVHLTDAYTFDDSNANDAAAAARSPIRGFLGQTGRRDGDPKAAKQDFYYYVPRFGNDTVKSRAVFQEDYENGNPSKEDIARMKRLFEEANEKSAARNKHAEGTDGITSDETSDYRSVNTPFLPPVYATSYKNYVGDLFDYINQTDEEFNEELARSYRGWYALRHPPGGQLSPVIDILDFANFTPIGNAVAAYDAADAASKGNYFEAGLLGGLTLVPFGNKIYRKARSGYRKFKRNLDILATKQDFNGGLQNFEDWWLQFEEPQVAATDLWRTQFMKDYSKNYYNLSNDRAIQHFRSDFPDIDKYFYDYVVGPKQLDWLDRYKDARQRASKYLLRNDVVENAEKFSSLANNGKGPLSQTQRQYLDQLIAEDPLYFTYVINNNLDPLSQSTVDVFLKKQTTSLRGVNSDLRTGDDVVEKMLTENTQRNTKGGDRLNTRRTGIYTSDSGEIAERFSRPQNNKVTRTDVAMLQYPYQNDPSLSVVDQLRQFRRGIFNFDVFGSDFEKLRDPAWLANRGYFAKEAAYANRFGQILPANERAYIAQTPNQKLLNVIDQNTKYTNENLKGRWAINGVQSQPELESQLFESQLVGNSPGDFVRAARTMFEASPKRIKTLDDLRELSGQPFYNADGSVTYFFPNEIDLVGAFQKHFATAGDEVTDRVKNYIDLRNKVRINLNNPFMLKLADWFGKSQEVRDIYNGTF